MLVRDGAEMSRRASHGDRQEMFIVSGLEQAVPRHCMYSEAGVQERAGVKSIQGLRLEASRIR